MKTRKEALGFDPTVLMSFNELAWILIFALGLIAFQSWSKNGEKAKSIKALEESNTESQRQVQKQVAELEKLAKEAEVLKTAHAALGGNLAAITGEARADKLSLDEMQRLAASHLVQLQRDKTTILTLEERDRESRERAGVLQDRQRLMEEQLAELQRRATAENAAFTALQAQFAVMAALPGAEGIPKQLLGFSGKMERVVFVIDRSSSMQSRWASTLAVVKAWIELLPISECALVVFGTVVDNVPADRSMLSMKGPDGAANRTKLFAQVPKDTAGVTATYAALEAAYGYRGVDTIILFTDGAPSYQAGVPGAANDSLIRNEKLNRNIEALVGRHPGVTLNCVGVGDYYKDERFTEFLLNLARGTGGGFIGR